MATLGATYLNLMDLVDREKPDHTVATVAEILNKQNPTIQSIPWATCNDGTQNISHVRTNIPTATVVGVGDGAPLGKSNVSPVTDTTSRIAIASEVSKRVIQMNGNEGAQRALEARAMLEAVNQKWNELWFYGNASTGIPGAVDAKTFNGLAYRYGSLSAANIKEQIIDAGGTGTDNTSIWMAVYSPKTICGLIPQGAGIGITHTPVNGGVPVSKTLSNGNIDEFYQDIWELHCGMKLEDYRGVVRIANVDVSALAADSSAADLIKLMIKGYHLLDPVMSLGTPVIHMSRTSYAALDVQAAGKLAGNLTTETVDSKIKTMFRQIPIIPVHQLKDNEARVV